MRVDRLVGRSEGAALADEVAALRTRRRFVAHGVRQESGGRLSQFRFVMDEPAQTWELDRDRVGGGPRHEEYRDGIARRHLQLGETTILTEVRPLSEGEVLPPPRFEPLTDWIRPDY